MFYFSVYLFLLQSSPFAKTQIFIVWKWQSLLWTRPTKRSIQWKEDPYEISRGTISAPSPTQKHTVQYTSNCPHPLNVPWAIKVVEILQQGTYKVSAESAGDLNHACIPRESEELEGSNSYTACLVRQSSLKIFPKGSFAWTYPAQRSLPLWSLLICFYH